MLEPPTYGRLRMRIMAAAVVLCLALAAPRSVATHLAETCQYFLLRPAIREVAESVELPNDHPSASAVVPSTEVEDQLPFPLTDAILQTVARDQGVWVDADSGILPGAAAHLPGTIIRALGARGSNRLSSGGAGGNAVPTTGRGPQVGNDDIATAVARTVADGGGLGAHEDSATSLTPETPLIPEGELPTPGDIDDLPMVAPIGPFDPNEDALLPIDRIIGGGNDDVMNTNVGSNEDGDDTQSDDTQREVVLDDSNTESVDPEDDGRPTDIDIVGLDAGRIDRRNFDYENVRTVDEHKENSEFSPPALFDVVAGSEVGGVAAVPEPSAVFVWSLLVVCGLAARWLRK